MAQSFVPPLLIFPLLFKIIRQTQLLIKTNSPSADRMAVVKEKKNPWPLLVFATSDKAASRRIQQARRAGELQELLPQVYTSDLTTDPALLVRRHWLPLLGHLYPEAVISHRSGLDAHLPRKGTFSSLTNTPRK